MKPIIPTVFTLVALLTVAWLASFHASPAYAGPHIGPGLSSGAQVIGRGCTTAYFIDQDCDGCGPGVKASNQYPVTVTWKGTATTNSTNVLTINSTTAGYLQAWTATAVSGPGIPAHDYIASFGTYNTTSGTGTVNLTIAATSSTGPAAMSTGINFSAAPYWTNGDTPDADDTDPTVCTAAEWMAKYGWTDPPTTGNRVADNNAMVTFLNTRKAFLNTSNLYYLAPTPTGNDAACESGSTAVPNRPDLPCATMAPIMTALMATTSVFSGSYTAVVGSNILTVTSVTSGALTFGTKIAGPGLPGNNFIVRQLSGLTSGVAANVGTYQTSLVATANEASPVATTSAVNYPGGAVIIRGGSAVNLHFGAPNPNFELGGSPGHALLVMNFPGEVSAVTQNAGGDAISATGTYAPGHYDCCVIIDGLQFNATAYGTGDGIHGAFLANWEFRNCEMAGYDDGVLYAEQHRDVLVKNCVFHDVDHHAVYYSWGGGQFTITGTLVNGSNVMTVATTTANSINPMLGSIVCRASVSPCTGIFNSGTGSTEGAASYTWITQQLTGTTNGPGTYLLSQNATATVSSPQSMVGLTSANLGAQTGDFNFALDDLNYFSAIPVSTGAGYNGRIVGNVAYNSGNGGYEPFHINTVMDGAYIMGNISSYNGGAGAALQTGDYNSIVTGNIFFDNGADCMNLFLNKSIVPMTIRWSLIAHNVCWNGTATDQIRAGSPGGGWSQRNPSQNGVNYWVKDSVFKGNVIVGYYASTSSLGAFEMDEYSYPLTDTIGGTGADANILWNNQAGNSPCCVLQVDPLAQGITGGTYPFSGGTSFSTYFPNNTYAGGNPYANAVDANFLTPGLFNFAPYNLVN